MLHTKVNTHIDREIAVRPELVQIEDGWRKPSEKRPDAVQRGHFREIEHTDNPDAEPVAPCAAAKPALVVYGKRVGTNLTVCTDNNCPVHDPRAAARLAEQEREHPTPATAHAAEEETPEEAAHREAEYQQRRKEYEDEQNRKAEERRVQQEKESAEYEARQAQQEEQRKAREATFERILENAPESFTAAQLRVLLRTLINLDLYTIADDLARDINGGDENDQRSAEEVLLSTIDSTADDKLTRFALRLALSGHVGIPRKNEADFLTEAGAVFTTSQNKAKVGKTGKRTVTTHTPKAQPKKKTDKKQIAA